MLNSKNIDKLISQALEIESEEAKAAGALGYMARALVQATLPHKNPGNVSVWGRRNGNFSMIMQPGYLIDQQHNSRSIGLPYGSKPRLLMAFISSEAIKTKTKEIVLGRSLSEFMRQLNLIPTGGRWGTISMLKEQIKRLFSATVSFQYEEGDTEVSGGFRIASRTVLFWDTISPEQRSLWESTVTLTQEFYEEIISHPVPLDMRALGALKNSSLALDIYCWLTYRMSYLRNPTHIPWELLAMQFGSEYTNIRDFRKNFIRQLRKVFVIYAPNVEPSENGLLLKPSNSHIHSSSKSVEKI